jgi:hypothetical protein
MNNKKCKNTSMITTTSNLRTMSQLTKSLLAAAIAGASLTANATDFTIGEAQLRWTNQISYGIGWRMEDPDGGQVAQYGTSELVKNASGSSYNYDDGNLNFEKGDVYTSVFKANTELELNWRNYGAFIRAKVFYDTELADGDRPWKDLNKATIDASAKGYELLDSYVWAEYELGETPLSLRLGKQVVSWGESTFIQNGINSINPVDVAAFRRPGAEIKEGLLPVEMLYASIGLSPNVTLEAFYQLKWEKTRIDPCGTLFSTVDFIADSCGPVILAGADGEKTYMELRNLELHQSLTTRNAPITERLQDDTPKDDGQFGFALRWYAEELANTEFGFYYMNIHSRLPNINGVVTNINPLTKTEVNPDPLINSKFPLYQIAFPEDIKIMGLSFATSTESGYSLSGEMSLKQDYPVQWNAFEVLLGGLGIPFSRLYQQRLAEAGGDPTELFGNHIEGYDRLDIWQAQMTAIKFYNRVLGADKLNVVGEAGITYVESLSNTDKDSRYGRSGAYGIGTAAGVSPLFGSSDPCLTGINEAGTGANENPAYCTDDGYVDKVSAGIRVRMSLDYNDAFAGVNLSPNLAIGYDLGNSPDAGQQFLDKRLTTNLGVKLVYLYQFAFDANYTTYSGGGDYNQLGDRDTFTLSGSYSF